MCDENNRNHYEKISGELSNRIDQRISGLTRPRRHGGKVVMALSLMVCVFGMMVVVHNPAIAENIPVVEELLHYFNRDKGVQYANNHGYELAEVTGISDGYRAYMKDVVSDGERIRGKLAVVDPEGNFMEGYNHLFIKMNQDTEVNYVKGLNLSRGGKDPWYDFNEPFRDVSSQGLDLVITTEAEMIVFEDMAKKAFDQCKYVGNKPVENKRYVVNEKYEGSFGSILVNYIELTPISTKVNYSIEGKEGYSMPWISKDALRLPQGQDYYTKPRILINNDRSKTIEYEGSFYYEPLPIKLEFCVNSFRAYDLTKTLNIELKKGRLEKEMIISDNFSIGRVKDLGKEKLSSQGGTYELRLDSLIPIEHTEFPISVIKNKYGEWARGCKTEDYSSQTVSFTKKECEEVIGTKLEELLELEDKAFDVAALPFFIYYGDKIGKSLPTNLSEEEKLLRLGESRENYIEVIKSISDQGVLYTSWDKEVSVTELSYEFRDMEPDKESIELGILGEMVKADNIIIPITLEEKIEEK